MIAGLATHEAQLERDGGVARLDATELVNFRTMTMLDIPSFARKLNVPPEHLEMMELGTLPIPGRFDNDVYTVVGRCIDEIVGPGPMRDYGVRSPRGHSETQY